MSLSIFIVDDNADDREAMQRILTEIPEIKRPALEAVDGKSCQAVLDGDPEIDCILLDYSLPRRDGLKVLHGVLRRNLMATVVMVTGQGDEEVAVAAMKTGAQDYLAKDVISVASLTRAIVNATERTRMQRKIREQQDSLQTFARVIGHDLRAPLSGIRQSIGMLLEDIPEAVAADNAELLNFVVQGAQRMDALIVVLNSYTEIDGTRPAFESVGFNVQIDHVCANLVTIIDERNAAVICEHELPTILGDPPQIEQLLQNLIGNGIKYNRSGAPEIRISLTETADQFAIKIIDNGIGIEPQFLQRIFEPFERLHGQSEFEGTGLGLATCRKIAERHKGTLTCQSEPGSGSTFTLFISREPLAGRCEA